MCSLRNYKYEWHNNTSDKGLQIMPNNLKRANINKAINYMISQGIMNRDLWWGRSTRQPRVSALALFSNMEIEDKIEGLNKTEPP